MEALQRENDKAPWTSALERAAVPWTEVPQTPETDSGSKLTGTFRCSLKLERRPGAGAALRRGGLAGRRVDAQPAAERALQEPWLLQVPCRLCRPCMLGHTWRAWHLQAGSEMRVLGSGKASWTSAAPLLQESSLSLSPKSRSPQATLKCNKKRPEMAPESFTDFSQLGFYRVGSGPFRSQAVPECVS